VNSARTTHGPSPGGGPDAAATGGAARARKREAAARMSPVVRKLMDRKAPIWIRLSPLAAGGK
jgi:hypothetical protein